MSLELGQALARARGFVDANGDELARRRVRTLLGETSCEPVLELLSSQPLGSSAFVLSDLTQSPELTRQLETLAILADLRCLDAAPAEHAVAYVGGVQHPDGSWGEGAEAGRLVLTGLLGGFLARTFCVRPRTLEAAAAFLAARWRPERVRSGDYPLLVAFAAFFSNACHELSDAALQWCGRELERGFRTRGLDALRTARVLTLCDAEALPGARVDGRELLAALLSEQRADGSWRSTRAASVAVRVSNTLEGVLALVRFAPVVFPLPGGRGC
jgi:hypothetical protein